MSFRTELRDFVNGFFGDSSGLANGFITRSGASEAGVEVNETTAMTIGAVAACQRIISSAVASLGCYIYEDLGDGGHRLATEHELFNLVSLTPSPEYPAVDFYAAGTVNALQTGNAYIQIVRTNGGDPAELLLRSPFGTYPRRRGGTGAIEYITTDTPTGAQSILSAGDVIHVKGLGVNPYMGLSPMRSYMREVLGVALAAQAYGARLFKNDARPGGYLATDKVMKEDAKLAQIQSWVAGHKAGNQNMPAILDGGMTWEKVGINPEEAQFLQTREFQRSEIASIYGVPAHMLGDPSETKATIEQKALEFLIWTVKPWLRRWEQAMNVKLFPTPTEKKSGPKPRRYFIKFDTSEYERSDYATMTKGLQTGRYAGLMTVDEGRKLLGLNPTTADNFNPNKPGSGLWRPVNMAIAGEDPSLYSSGGAGASPDAPAEDQPAPADDGGDDSRSFPALFPLFLDGLRRIATRKEPDSRVWREALGPVFLAVSDTIMGEKTTPAIVGTLITGVISEMEAKGIERVTNADLLEFNLATTAIVRACIAHREETKND